MYIINKASNTILYQHMIIQRNCPNSILTFITSYKVPFIYLLAIQIIIYKQFS